MHLALAALALAAAPAAASGPLGDAPIAGPRTQVVNLAAVHLSEQPGWTAPMLAPLVEKLAAFKPTIITHEQLSGEQCHAMRQFPDRYAETADQYCFDPSAIAADTRLTVPEALKAVDETLKTLPADAAPAQRRRLAMLFLAAGDRASAQVQWRRLPPAERRAGDGLTDAMVTLIARPGKPLNESYDVAAALAARLGLDRVHAVDDHSSDAAVSRLGKPFDDALTAHFDAARQSPLLRRADAERAAVKDGNGLLALFRAINARGAMDAQIRADFGGAMAQDRPGTPARAYVGWWETRNLRMVANIRESFAARPGARVLNIVGASHKPWYDALLATMGDVTLVDSGRLLTD